MADSWGLMIAIIILIMLSAFFSSAETAFTMVNVVRLQVKADEGNRRAARVLKILENKEAMISTILIGNNVVNIAASSITTAWAYVAFEKASVAVVTGILTLVILIVGEIVPKSVASARAMVLACAYSGVIYVLVVLLKPITALFFLLQKGVLRLFKVSAEDLMTEKELMSLIDTGLREGAIEDDEFEMIANVVDLDKRTARDIMVKRPDITFIPQDASMKEIVQIYRDTNYTRYPILDEDGEHVIGTINMKDLLFADWNNLQLSRLLREPHFTFEHRTIDDLLHEMREHSQNMMIVLDEYGMIAGLITLEDILEEIVGEIHDEYDKDEKDPIVAIQPGKEYLIDGATSILDVSDETGIALVSEEYDSIGGYMIEQLDRLPKKGEVVELADGSRLIAEIVRYNRVEKVHLILGEKSEA
ncbi:MAG: hemolysin family protein [Lachnospiraceae bacterium]|nr:hemolysin family protein [Lachnospiraceae bacterium]